MAASHLLPRILLTWYDATDEPRIGECWTFTVRLRRPRGFSNPVSFDYEGWLFRQSVGATGYVRGDSVKIDCGRVSELTRVRRHFVDRISALLPEDNATAVVLAITVGARHKINDEQWRRYAITGTSHLMAISGLHIGLAAGGGFFLIWFLLALCRLAWHSVSVVLYLIDRAAQLPYSELRIAELKGFVLLTTATTLIWVVLPASWPGRKLAWLAALGSVLHLAPRPARDCVEIHALDVGQGLATVVLTKSHTLIYDTGPAFRSGSDTGALVLVPFLRGKGIDNVDVVVVSHGDNDHAGGVGSLTAEIRVGEILSGEPLPRPRIAPASQTLCEAGQRWHWDGVDFTILHPGPDQIRLGNNASCVLEIRVGTHLALLTGDIELAAERQLLEENRLSSAELVFVPHHGSRTSSHAAFIARLRPRTAVISAGFDNQWGFPKDDVVAALGSWRRRGRQYGHYRRTILSNVSGQRPAAGRGAAPGPSPHLA